MPGYQFIAREIIESCMKGQIYKGHCSTRIEISTYS